MEKIHRIRLTVEAEIPQELMELEGVELSISAPSVVLNSKTTEQTTTEVEQKHGAEAPQEAPDSTQTSKAGQSTTLDKKEPRKRARKTETDVVIKSSEEQPAEEQPAEEQPAEEQPAEEQPAEEQTPTLYRNDIKKLVLGNKAFGIGSEGRKTLKAWFAEKSDGAPYNTDTLPGELFTEFANLVKTIEDGQ